MRLSNRCRPRRKGILLLIVLSLLILFVLIGVTFIVAAGAYRRQSLDESRHDRLGDPPRQLLDSAVMMSLRGASIRQTPIGGHAMLIDLYGNDGFRGRVFAVNPIPNAGAAQLWDVIVDTELRVQADGTRLPRQTSHYYSGSVVTFISGPSIHESARVLEYEVVDRSNLPNIKVRIRCDGLQGMNFTPGDALIVNGRPLNGTGTGMLLAGIGPPTPLEQQRQAFQYLHPNYSSYFHLDEQQHMANRYGGQPIFPQLQDADESWDAVDPHNMFLAMFSRNVDGAFTPVGTGTPSTDPGVLPDPRVIIPSYHRPELINYLAEYASAQGFSPEEMEHELHMSVLRPLPGDPASPDDNVHPNFTGSNPAASPPPRPPNTSDADYEALVFTSLMNFLRYGPWDVDNDGDTLPDSIWVDVGFPPQRTPDGIPYKPLVALLIRDQDGRVNINTADSQKSLPRVNLLTVSPLAALMPGGAGINTATLPRGLGYGPSEVGLEELFSGTGAALSQELVNARYFERTKPTYNSQIIYEPGHSLLDSPSIDDDTLISPFAKMEIPVDHSVDARAYLSPPDVFGRGTVAIDLTGRPLWTGMGEADETKDDPYESDLVNNPSTDWPYEDQELEFLLRNYDHAQTEMPERIKALFGGLPSNQIQLLKELVTSRSFDVPVANQQVPAELRHLITSNGDRVSSLLDLYDARLTNGGVLPVNLAFQMHLMIPFEIVHGGRFNLNRPFGDGIDNNGNGVTDEPGEEPPHAVTNGEVSITTGQPIPPRQIFARHLYCLLMMLIDDRFISPEYVGLSNVDHQRDLTRRQIAQWVINLVDFRDSDAVMTPFEYDVNPYNGWDVDDDPKTTDNATPDRRLVFGMEYPELLLTETKAFHDRGVKDTDDDDASDATGEEDAPQARVHSDPNKVGDKDLDQYRVPQGSLFLELYCARSAAEAFRPTSLPRELYTPNGKLDLGRTAPAGTPSVTAVPVWRIAISEQHHPQGVASTDEFNTTTESPYNYAFNELIPNVPKRLTTSFEPFNMEWIGAPNTLDLERFVWLSSTTTVNPSGHPDATRIIAAESPPQALLLDPNRYCVIGPRAGTAIGDMTQDIDGNPNNVDESNQKLNISGGIFASAATDPVSPPPSGNTLPALGIVASAPAPAAWGSVTTRVGVNISEPLPTAGYYPEPSMNDGTGRYFDRLKPKSTAAIGRNAYYDRPFDRNEPANPNAAGEYSSDALRGMVSTGTYFNVRTAFLQRLANPMAPWNPLPVDAAGNPEPRHNPMLELNPYITVDWMPIDLTVFSGAEDTNKQLPNNDWIDPLDVDPFSNASLPNEYFESREKGAPDELLWSAFAAHATQRSVRGAGPDTNFPYSLRHTLGYLNRVDNFPGPATPWGLPASSAFPGYAGSPQKPFPWLPWHNRPFVSHLEIVQVPRVSAARLPLDFGTANKVNQPYNGATANPTDYQGTFPHLLNFLNSSDPNNMPAAAATVTSAANFHRLLDYVEVPSPYAGTRRWFNRTQFDPVTAPPSAMGFYNPFSYVPRFREPGKININTVFDPLVWNALMARHPDWQAVAGAADPRWDEFVKSRRGYDVVNTSNYPTFFANPFRTSAGADAMPVQYDPTLTSQYLDLRRAEADATLLRRTTTTGTSRPFLPATNNPTGPPHVDPERNSYFYYQGLQRLGNLVTTHSNVYACWVTVGYFELDQNPATGEFSRLGQEVGWDTGDTKRHRAFYLIDRSIPVGFEPGENHNVDKCIVLRRYIE